MKENRGIKIYVMLSGGVDSSVTVALLKEQGYDIRGIHIKMWSDPTVPCNFKEDRMAAMRAAAHLDIPFETWDFTKEYKSAVVEYLIAEYAAGRTPNPDVMCNRRIKFGVFLDRALAAGADMVATGHYVRLKNTNFPSVVIPAEAGIRVCESVQKNITWIPDQVRNDNAVSFGLLQAKDQNKDQSYFLWTLTQKQLKHCLFPLGDYTKPEVRELARKFGLPNAEKPDSQGICFIGEIDLKEFLQRSIPVERGQVVTSGGKVLGEHDGLPFYTIGQREGLGFGGGIPYYVAEKHFETNTLIVAEGPYDEKLFTSELTAGNVHWIAGEAPKLPFECEARIRYRQPLQICSIKMLNVNGQMSIVFQEPQRAVTPGQSIVFYKGQEMIGGGIIIDK